MANPQQRKATAAPRQLISRGPPRTAAAAARGAAAAAAAAAAHRVRLEWTSPQWHSSVPPTAPRSCRGFGERRGTNGGDFIPELHVITQFSANPLHFFLGVVHLVTYASEISGPLLRGLLCALRGKLRGPLYSCAFES